jgi:uncharacterized membrane protein YfcA
MDTVFILAPAIVIGVLIGALCNAYLMRERKP